MSAFRAFINRKNTVTGLLTDADGNPIIGATVSIKGTTHGVTTDIDGRYVLNNVNEDDIIEYRYIGFNTEEKRIKAKRASISAWLNLPLVWTMWSLSVTANRKEERCFVTEHHFCKRTIYANTKPFQ